MWITHKPLSKNTFKYIKKSAGRNSIGKITTRHRGGGQHKKFKIVDFGRFVWNVPAFVLSIEKSSHHSGYLALVGYPIGIISYILAPHGLKPGNIIFSGDKDQLGLGCSNLLSNIPFNIKIHNIEAWPGSGGVFARSAGSWAKVLEKSTHHTVVLLKGGLKKKLSNYCAATIGRVSNLNHKTTKRLFNAGSSRVLGKRPRVRGVAMNAVDHPHGGGKGKKSPKNPNYNFIRKLPKGRPTAR